MATQTVIQYVLGRLKQLGIDDIFGVPGDYSFPVNDAICEEKKLRWIGNCNELNAAYAADGYARIKGVAAVCTTFGVGELSALNGIAGSFAEHAAVFHLVGTPKLSHQLNRAILHHSLGGGAIDIFKEMSEPVTCAQAVLTPGNCVFETNRLIDIALYHRRPVYFAFPKDCADKPITDEFRFDFSEASDPKSLEAAVTMILNIMEKAKRACVLPGIFLSRFGVESEAKEFMESSGLPYATMLMDKGIFDETSAEYAGMYCGGMMDAEVREFVEGCDAVFFLTSLRTDLNTGGFSVKIDPKKCIQINPHEVRIGDYFFANIEMADLLKELTKRMPKRGDFKRPKPHGLGEPKGSSGDPIVEGYLYPRLQQMFRPDDIVVVDTGTVMLGLGNALLPKNVSFQNQALWGSIGWATPAALGAALAAPHRRLILATGEGSHQVTVQEISQFKRYGLKPIILVINNEGYLIERLLGKNPDIYYNDLAQWNYSKLPEVLGCTGWYSAKVQTCGELDLAIKEAEKANTGAYIEIVTGKYEAPELSKKFRQAFISTTKEAK